MWAAAGLQSADFSETGGICSVEQCQQFYSVVEAQQGKSCLQKDVNHRPSCSYIFVTLIVNIYQLSWEVA